MECGESVESVGLEAAFPPPEARIRQRESVLLSGQAVLEMVGNCKVIVETVLLEGDKELWEM
jgi:hypothetical protein